jgi:1-acyl-sn-glycerol-3-phosphate acyltransferase
MTEQERRELAIRLRNAITEEVLLAMGALPHRWVGKALTPVLRLATRRFAQIVAAFDLDVGRLGTRDAARNLLPHLVEGCRQSGAGSIPETGPLLVGSNHPGGVDSMSILAALPRSDVKFVVSDVPFLRALRNCREHAAYASADPSERLGVVRQMIRHLSQGGVVIIFPGTQLDPDPAFMPGAAARLQAWSHSIALLLRRVPDTYLVPTIVGGVLSPRFQAHPFTRLAPPGWERIKLAEMLQIMQQLVLGTRLDLQPTVIFDTPVRLTDLVNQVAKPSSTAIMSALLHRTRQALDQYQAGQVPTHEVPIPARTPCSLSRTSSGGNQPRSNPD